MDRVCCCGIKRQAVSLGELSLDPSYSAYRRLCLSARRPPPSPRSLVVVVVVVVKVKTKAETCM